MKTHWNIKTIICAVMLLIGSTGSATLLYTEDFETGDNTNPDGWLNTTFEGTAEYIIDGTAGQDVYTGTHAVSVSSPTNKLERWFLGTSAVVGASENIEYTLTAWVKTEGLTTSEAYISMDWLNTEKSRIGLVKSTAITANQDWTLISVTGTAKVDTAYIRPVLYIQNTEAAVDLGATVFFDDLQITTVPEAGTVGLFGIAGGFFFLLRRITIG